MMHGCKAASQKMNISTLHLVVYSISQSVIQTGTQGAGADLVNWGPQANIGMGPNTFAHIYQINLEVPFLS